ncbi:MAG: hypothetical protein HUJ54_12460 [Erysipelotrichaceae bacterium]|nr:hypothetical protein [Erysipelotrichaceae bacterium]
MNKFNINSVKENKNRPAWVTPEILVAKRRSYLWKGAALLCTAAAAVAAKVILSSIAASEITVMLPMIRNTALLLVMAFSLVISIICKKANPAATHAFMIADSIAAGILAAVLLNTVPVRIFCLMAGLAAFLTICLLYLGFKCKYDPEEVDPELLKYHPYIYIPH